MREWLKSKMEWLKWKIAGDEIDELHRWRMHWNDTRRWLVDFEDAISALDHLRQQVDGVRMIDIQRLRDNMRARRQEGRNDG